jgi:hypothetical protein
VQTIEETTTLHANLFYSKLITLVFRASVFKCVLVILLLFVMSFRQWSNIFLADQDERQRCFFADQKQFPADH